MQAPVNISEEVQKTKLEIFIVAVQKSTFDILHLLAVNDSNAPWAVFLCGIIETLQLIGLLIPSDSDLIPWNADNKASTIGIIGLVDHVRPYFSKWKPFL